MILVSPQYNVTGVGSPGSSTDRALATWNGTSGATLRSNSTVGISSSNTLDLSGADLRFVDNTYNIGVTKGQTTNGSTDYRPNVLFLKGHMHINGWMGFDAPYGLNTSSFNGLIYAGNTAVSNVGTIMGTSNVLNATAQAFYGFGKDNTHSDIPAFVSLNSRTDFDVYFSNIHLSSARTDLIKFGGDGTLTMLKSSGANLLWNTDGAGDVGAVGNNRPGHIYAASSVQLGDSSAFAGAPYLEVATGTTSAWFIGGTANFGEIGYQDANGYVEFFVQNDAVLWHTQQGQVSFRDGATNQQLYFDAKQLAIFGIDTLQGGGTLSQALFVGQAEDKTLTGTTFGAAFSASSIEFGAYGGSPVASLETSGQIRVASVGVGNSASASTPGTVVKKIEIFDGAGTSLGYIPVYDAIT